MGPLAGIRSKIGGRRAISGLGAGYILLGMMWPLVQMPRTASLGEELIISLLVGGAGVTLLYWGYRLPQTEIRPEFFDTVASWCFRAVGVMVSILVLIALVAQLNDPANNFLILPALAAVAGTAAGRHDARAKTRTFTLEQRNQELRETQAELEETIVRLEKSNERLEQFAYAASHDLQEPLRMVSSYLQLIERRYGDELDAEGEEFLEYALDGAERMRSMIDGLLQYSRIETMGSEFEPVELADVFDDACENLQVKIEESGAEITADPLPRVNGDENQLHQVFQNLLANAIEYSGDEPPRVHLSAERGSEGWTVSVADQGIGIEPEYQEQMFEVFEGFHGDGEYAGTGIGLAVCQRIVERHGGEIWAESEPGEGSTFSFTLPAVPGSAA